jgi:hypothetical protein
MPVGLRDAAPPSERVRSLRRWAWVTLLLLIAGHMAAAYAPFRLDPPRRVDNGVTVDAGVVTIAGDAVARTPGPPSWLDDARRTGAFWMVLDVRSLGLDHDGPVRIVDIEASHARANLKVSQVREDLVVSVRRPDANAVGDPGLFVPGVFADDAWHELRIAAGPEQFAVSVDGAPPVSHTMAGHGAYRTWDTTFRLYVGDAADGNRPWHGQVRRLEAGAGDRSEDYLAPGALEVPRRIWYVPERVDDPLGWRSDRGRAAPLAVAHFVTFVPVGVLAGAVASSRPAGRRRGRRRPGEVVWGGLMVVAAATAIQAGKVLFDARHPALVDLVTESAGGLVGLALWRAWLGRRSSGSSRAGDELTLREE